MFNIVLVEPEIPNNTGNIGRTCVGTGCKLHLIEPLGFEITNTRLKRAGLDYWEKLSWSRHANFNDWEKLVPDMKRAFFFSKKATRPYYNIQYQPGDWLVFGKETKGLSEEILSQHGAQAVQIPMYGPIRSLNVSNAVAIAVYEGFRQLEVRRQNQGESRNFLQL